MKLTYGSSSLEIAFQEFGRDQRSEPTEVKLAVRVESFGFVGSNDRIWVFRSAFSDFASAIQILVRDRRGEAVLDGMSPDVMRVRVSSIDGAGHIGVDGFLGQVAFDYGQERVESRIGFSFQIDAGLFGNVPRELSGLVPEAQNV